MFVVALPPSAGVFTLVLVSSDFEAFASGEAPRSHAIPKLRIAAAVIALRRLFFMAGFLDKTLRLNE